MTTRFGLPAKYINPFTDFGFRKLFGTEANKELLMNFMQVLLQKEGTSMNINRINEIKKRR